MTKPTDLPEWDTTQINSLEPDTDHKTKGWLAPSGVPEKPKFQWFNHWQNNVYTWIDFFNDAVGDTKFIGEYDGDLAAAVADIGSSTPTNLIINSEPDPLAAALTISRNILIHWSPDAIIDLGIYDLTLYSRIVSRPYQLFNYDSTGVVILGDNYMPEVYPEWWGATPYTLVDSAPAINACIESVCVGTYRPEIIFSSGTYTLDTEVEISAPQGLSLRGVGGYYSASGSGFSGKVTTLYYTGNLAAITVGAPTVAATGFKMESMYIKGTSSAVIGGVDLDAAAGLTFRDCTFGLFSASGAAGVIQRNSHASSFYSCSFVGNDYGNWLKHSTGAGYGENTTTNFNGCVWNGNGSHASYITHAIGINYFGCTFQSNGGSAVYIDATVDSKQVDDITVWGGYIASNCISVATAAIDVRGLASPFLDKLSIEHVSFQSPGASEIAHIRLRNTTNAFINNPRFASISTDAIIAAASDNNKVLIDNWRYASSYIKDAASGNVEYWSKEVMFDDYRRIIRGGNFEVDQEDPNLAEEAIRIWQQCPTSPVFKLSGTGGATTTNSFSTNKADAVIVGYVQSTIGGAKRWIPYYGDPASDLSTLADSATPSISAGNKFLTGGTTTITDFTGGYTGKKFHIVSEHAITITEGTNIFMEGSVDFVMASGDTLTLIQKADGNFYQLGRCVL